MEDKKADIFKCGKELFSSKGFKDTNVSDITKLAGIGVGTFYNYYSSKEQLFMEIYLKENEEHKRHLLESMNLQDDPVSMITKMVARNATEMNSNPILKEWYNKELFSRLEKSFLEKGGIENFDEINHSGAMQLIRVWKSEGKMRNDLDDELIAAIFKSILYIDMHKSEIGIQHFPHILFHITEFIMKGLTDCRK